MHLLVCYLNKFSHASEIIKEYNYFASLLFVVGIVIPISFISVSIRMKLYGELSGFRYFLQNILSITFANM